MINFTADNITVAAGAVAFSFLTGFLVTRKLRKAKAGAAAKAGHEFRNKILAELKGLYPVPRKWSDDAYNRFRETLPGIQAAAAAFRVHVPPGRRGAFDTALKRYSEQCSDITWQSCATFGVVEKNAPDEVGPKEQFRQNVNTLLSFAKES